MEQYLNNFKSATSAWSNSVMQYDVIRQLVFRQIGKTLSRVELLAGYEKYFAMALGVLLLVSGGPIYRVLEIAAAAYLGYVLGYSISGNLIRIPTPEAEFAFVLACIALMVLLIVKARVHAVRVIGCLSFAHFSTHFARFVPALRALRPEYLQLAASLIGALLRRVATRTRGADGAGGRGAALWGADMPICA